MPYLSAVEFRKQRANELLKLCDVLLTNQTIRNPTPLQSAAAECQDSSLWENDCWGYDLAELVFDNPLAKTSLKHLKPTGAKDIRVELSVSVRGECIQDDDFRDPFTELTTELVVTGKAEDGRRLWCAWHLDRHLHNDDDGEPECVHPEYHFHYGGKRIWALEQFDDGQYMLLEPPRLAHPPLDGILAIDFVLSNYFGDQWRIIRDGEAAYAGVVKESLRRVWRPYALGTAAVWRGLPWPIESVWSGHRIWPQLL